MAIFPWLRRRTVQIGAIALAAVGLVVLMLQFDPAQMAVGRQPALREWLTRLLAGEFPYAGSTHPSGLPFLFVLALPFYLLGDVGVLQIAGYVLFAYLLSRRGGPTGRGYLVQVLLLASPMFLWEVVTRSDLFANMVVVLLVLWLLYTREDRMTGLGAAALGAAAGLVLSTRLIVGLVYLIWSGVVLGLPRRHVWLYCATLMLSFILTLLPFVFWNPKYFLEQGPFSIQATYAPYQLIILAVIVAALCARRVRSEPGLLTATALILFGSVGVAFVLSVARHGLGAAVHADAFDISYFVLPLPFALAALQGLGPDRAEPSCRSSA
jgi:hypothetical protein